jgi:hypothetical protein
MVSRVGGYEELVSTNLCAAVPMNRPHEYNLRQHMAEVAQEAEEIENHRGRDVSRRTASWGEMRR